MPSVEFWRPRLQGARFDDGQIPLQVLSDLTALREMVIDVAKWRYLSENPDRQRAPRGFANKIDLKLGSIDDGSAVPVINITTDEPILPGIPFPHQNFLEQARDAIAIAVATESENGHVSANGHLPIRFLAYFNRIGRSLRVGESLELPRANGSPPAMLTTATRQRLLQRSTVREITRELALRGTVPEADQERMTFELQPIHGGRVAGSIPEEHHDVIIEAFNGYWNGMRILVNGIGRYDRQGRLSGLDSIDQVTLLDRLDVAARLDELRAMQNGWLDGAGNAPSHQGLDWLSANFESHFPDDLPLPHLYPTPEGGIEAQWTLEANSIILEIHLNAHQGDWLRFAKEDDDNEDSQIFDLDDADAWQQFTGEIRRLTGEERKGMNDATLLHRIIKPHWWLQGEEVSSQAFRPGPEDDKQMSVYDGDQITAEAAWHHYTNDPAKSPPSGVLAVTAGECSQQILPVRSDPETFQEHVLIDFRKFGTNQTKK